MFEFEICGLNNTTMINEILEHSQTSKSMNVVIGYSGAGKSFALNAYKKKYKGVFTVELGRSVTGREMYNRILNEIKGEDLSYAMNTPRLIRAIKRAIICIPGNVLLIIDESGKFEKSHLEYFHELRNFTDKKCGLVLFGPNDFQRSVDLWLTNQVKGVEEFYTRVYRWCCLERPSNFEIIELLRLNNIMEFVGSEKLVEELISIPLKFRNWRDIRYRVNMFLETNPKNIPANKAQK